MEELKPVKGTKERVLIKGLIIAGMAVILMIPTLFIMELIKEREQRKQTVVEEVSSKWAGNQTFTGPVLAIPYMENVVNANGTTTPVRKSVYLLPDNLDMKADLKPDKRHRGLFEVLLYTSSIACSGSFKNINTSLLKVAPENILWNEATVNIGITDVKGLKNEIKMKWNDSIYTLNSGTAAGFIREGFNAPISVTKGGTYNFSCTIDIKGSEILSFTPVGKETSVTVNSAWKEPSFTGSILPDYDLKDGFHATWKSLSHTRNYPQQWVDSMGYEPTKSAFGVNLLIPVNNYQKTMRSIKYAILCILLTFAAFFIIDIRNKKSVHPLHYALIGMALVLFYTLLLSISEYLDFTIAYIIATVATIGLISWFVKSILGSGKLMLLMTFILMIIYVYIFATLQIQDYALIIGSIGLFIALGVIMNFARKIQW